MDGPVALAGPAAPVVGEGTWKVSIGMMPRGSGEYHEITPTSSAIGNQPLA